MSEAPERIYLQYAGDYEGAAKLEVTWCVEPQDDADTAYIRADLVEAAVKRAIEACSRKAEKLSECCQSCAGVGREVRAIFQDPDVIAKIIQGDA